ncbi:MAG TPA: hypothetical protein PKD37_02075 [Oligoflexia bacterium]|nr:hypothetical protein [Oligoflexia bacterium]HMP26763.1 hypothetical protein [Oligoflexia bacterium]
MNKRGLIFSIFLAITIFSLSGCAINKIERGYRNCLRSMGGAVYSQGTELAGDQIDLAANRAIKKMGEEVARTACQEIRDACYEAPNSAHCEAMLDQFR